MCGHDKQILRKAIDAIQDTDEDKGRMEVQGEMRPRCSSSQ